MNDLTKQLKYWRAERPDEWKMDEFLRLAEDQDKRIKDIEKSLCALVQMHKNHYGLDGAWDAELVKAERLLKGGE